MTYRWLQKGSELGQSLALFTKPASGRARCFCSEPSSQSLHILGSDMRPDGVSQRCACPESPGRAHPCRLHFPRLSLSCVSHRRRCSESQTPPISFSDFWSQPKFLLFLTTTHQLCMLDVSNKNQSSIVTVFCFVFQFCYCKGQPVLVFIGRVMSGSGLVHKIPLQLLCKRSNTFLMATSKRINSKHVSIGIPFHFSDFSIFGTLY